MKNEKIKKSSLKNKSKDVIPNFLKQKIKYFQNIIRRTILYVQKYKSMDILGASELNVCLKNLEDIFNSLKKIEIKFLKNDKNENLIEKLQEINNELAVIFRTFGTKKIDDLICVVFGRDFSENLKKKEALIYDTIRKYVHPIGYKLMSWSKEHNPTTKNNKLAKNRIVEDFMIVETAKNLDCFDLARTSRSFQTKVYGIKVAVHNPLKKKTLIICGIVDDILLECINDAFLTKSLKELRENIPTDIIFADETFEKFLKSLTIKELIIYSDKELYQKYTGYINQTNLIKQKTISQIVKEFLNGELYSQRTMLIQLLIKKSHEFQYLAYLLYDLLSNENNNGNIDTLEQTILFDSLPWGIKAQFRNAMKTTIKYTKDLSNYEINNIPIEQQICLMKVVDSVKEKAMNKLKEIKAKSEDSGSKARQYLNALLKIPFGIIKKEPILDRMKEIQKNFGDVLKLTKKCNINITESKKNYTSIEIFKFNKNIKENIVCKIKKNFFKILKKLYTTGKRENIINNVCFLNGIIKKNKLKGEKICHSGKRSIYMKNEILKFISNHEEDKIIIKQTAKLFEKELKTYDYENINIQAENLDTMINELSTEIKDISLILENSIHGHKNAKRQIERIIGQWINGENGGYCLGFEGPPGVGKTSLAKLGLAKCLIDENGKHRPFALIAMGGSSNASTLAGHNYTYVGSTWGRIVDILIEKKCMNPIIFIDELDKVSRTEHGKEIIGILTHLIDSTQNTCFQDKYFSGVDLDLSKALFIFSYNNPQLIDKILLDRIHRVKFEPLSLNEKLTIAYKYILPEILKKVGLTDLIVFEKEITEFIIQTYTNEAGVRKLKEIFFEIVSEINLEILTKQDTSMKIPFVVTKDLIEKKYLKKRMMTKIHKIHNKSKIGIINGLWANSMGLGGIITIECKWFPSTTFLDLKLTGMQGDVMKESMNVAKTLAWDLTPQVNKNKIINLFNKKKLSCGIHIHCPEGATPKDGPSAGTAITIALFSLFNNKKIKNTIAITGEMNLEGNVTAIGGLDCKINGGIRAGVTEFLFPEENKKEFEQFLEKYGDKEIVKQTSFTKISKIKEVLEMVFE